MESYQEFQKKRFQIESSNMSPAEAIAWQFSLLKTDLLEAAKLPELMTEGSLLQRFHYSKACKEDYQDVKEAVDLTVSEYQKVAYRYLVSEADAAVANGEDPLVALKSAIKTMVDDLEDEIKKAFVTMRNNAANPASPESPAQAVTGEPADDNSNVVSAPSLPATQVPAQPAGPTTSSASVTGPAANSGTSMPSVPATPNNASEPDRHRPISGSFQPAPYGSWKPSDGIWNGVKRLLKTPKDWLKNKWRAFRRRWHNDATRESYIFLEDIFKTSFFQVKNQLDLFRGRLDDLINRQIAPLYNKSVVSPADTSIDDTLASNDEAPAEDPQIDQNVDDGIPPEPGTEPEEKQPQPHAPVSKIHLKNAAEKLGVQLNKAYTPLRAEDVINLETGKPVGATWQDVNLFLTNKIADYIRANDPQFAASSRKTSSLSLAKDWMGANTIHGGGKQRFTRILHHFMERINKGNANFVSGEKPATAANATAKPVTVNDGGSEAFRFPSTLVDANNSFTDSQGVFDFIDKVDPKLIKAAMYVAKEHYKKEDPNITDQQVKNALITMMNDHFRATPNGAQEVYDYFKSMGADVELPAENTPTPANTSDINPKSAEKLSNKGKKWATAMEDIIKTVLPQVPDEDKDEFRRLASQVVAAVDSGEFDDDLEGLDIEDSNLVLNKLLEFGRELAPPTSNEPTTSQDQSEPVSNEPESLASDTPESQTEPDVNEPEDKKKDDSVVEPEAPEDNNDAYNKIAEEASNGNVVARNVLRAYKVLKRRDQFDSETERLAKDRKDGRKALAETFTQYLNEFKSKLKN